MRFFSRGDGTLRIAAVAIAVALFSGTTGAIAGGLITGKDIKNGTLAAKELTKKLRKKINKTGTGTAGGPGVQGSQGAQGAAGADGAAGAAGPATAATYSNPEWGQIDRNTLGSPTVALRGGPFVGAQSPPFGDGSLSLTLNGVPRTASANEAEQATFGNEVDFTGDPVSGLTQVGFHVYTTSENNGRGNPNMPSIKFEIDPNLSSTTSSYSTLQFMPSNSTANQWSGYIDATTAPASAAGNGWFMSGAAGTATGCVLATPCTFSQMQAIVDDGGDAASILTVAVGKGRDYAFAGAVDGLRINDTVYDFEPFGVVETSAS